jgi:hypothetical protein
MKNIKYLIIAILLFLHFQCTRKDHVSENSLPVLKGTGCDRKLYVNGEPFIMLAGELHNSSASGNLYMEKVWDRLVIVNLNTVLASVTWEMTEPEEGKFDFSNVDQLISQARQHNLKLVFLWFGTWKNACSSYAPAWVRTDTRRFPRSESSSGAKLNHLSCLGMETCNADARAFASLMKHIREVDIKEHTVLAIQVENEAGIRGDSRDRSKLANANFEMKVPGSLMKHLEINMENLLPGFELNIQGDSTKSGNTWEEVFGKDAGLVFMAWNTAAYIDRVAEAGKKEYPLPMYANSWLDTEGSVPGDYPSGGPIAKMIPVWQAAAPHLDFLAPDIYRPDFDVVCGMFKQAGNPLFIPEVIPDPMAPAKAFYAIGQGALCFSPFAIDNRHFFNADDHLARSYRILSDLMPYIKEYQGTARMAGFMGRSGEHRQIRLGDYWLHIDFVGTEDSALPGYGLAIAMPGGEFLVSGARMTVSFVSAMESGGRTEILSAYDMVYNNLAWIKDRRLNGDETGEGSDHNIQLRFTDDEIGVKTATIFYYE